MSTPILMLGAGQMGGAILNGWRLAKAFSSADLMIADPKPGDAAKAAEADGARLNPPKKDFKLAQTVMLAVKPQMWRGAAEQYAPLISKDAVVISIAAGIKSVQLSEAFGGRGVARVMPTTPAAICQGTASVYATTPEALARAHALFDPLGTVVDLGDEGLMHAATAVSGSAPAYLYAFLETLEAAGVAAGLSAADSSLLARSTITGAAALLASTGAEPMDLRRQVTSPGGTTEAALNVLLGENGLPPLLREAVARAMQRSKALGG